jgi:hypothetical protein
MSAQYTFSCSKCDFTVESWEDGNQYIEDLKGKRHFFYHPAESEVRDKIAKEICGPEYSEAKILKIYSDSIGNAPDHICRNCEKITRLNPEKDKIVCRKCGSLSLEITIKLAGKKCIKCDGIFSEGEFSAIS